MLEVTGFALSKTLSQLTGRKVGCAAAGRGAASRLACVYGLFEELPANDVVLVKTDLGLAGSLAGCLLGLPKQAVAEQCSKLPLDELMRDGVHEVLNVISAALANENRVVLRAMYTDENMFSAREKQVLRTPRSLYAFDVTVDGYTGGSFSIFYKG